MLDFSVFEENTLVAEYKNGKLNQFKHNLFLDYKLLSTAEEFLVSRVVPKFRWLDEMVEFYGIPNWDAYEICRRTHALMPKDFLWIRFEDEDESVDWEFVQDQIW